MDVWGVLSHDEGEAGMVEIEVMCASDGEVAAAEAEIERVAKLIEAQPLDAASGGEQ